MAKTIWLATWNCENMFPDNTMLNNFIPAMVNSASIMDKPDVIVIGLQEGMSSGPLGGAAKGASLGGHGKAALAVGILTAGVANAIGAAVGAASKAFSKFDWVSERVADALKSEYVHVGSSYMDGMTKLICNYQQLGVIVHKNVKGQLSNLTFQNVKCDMGGKGGIVAKFDFAGRKIGVMSAHLDSKKERKREKNITALMAALTNQANEDNPMMFKIAAQQQYNAAFFMGDLNYRLDPTIGNNVVQNAQYTVSELCDMIAGNRDPLWAWDTLNQSDLVKTGRYGWTFPKPNPLFPPTYKRAYKGSKRQGTIDFVTTPNAANAQKCYFAGEQMDDPAEIDDSRGQLNLGWLDRVGYITGKGTQVTVKGYVACERMVLSDHVPVVMKASIS